MGFILQINVNLTWDHTSSCQTEMKILTFSKLTKTQPKWTGKRDVQLKPTIYEKMKIIGNLVV